MDTKLWLLGHELSMRGFIEQAWEIRRIANQYGELEEENDPKRLAISIMLSKLPDNLSKDVKSHIHELLDH